MSFVYTPPNEQTPIFHGNLHGTPLEVVAHPKGEEGRQVSPLQAVFGPTDGDAVSLRPQAKDREDALLPRGQGDGAVSDGGEDEGLIVKIPSGPVLGQKTQALEVGQGVVHAPAGAAVEVEGAEALLQAQLHGQHGVGIVLFHREGLGIQRGGTVLQGVEIPQEEVWGETGGLAVAIAPVGGQDIVSNLGLLDQPIEGPGPDDIASGVRHNTSPFAVGVVCTILPRSPPLDQRGIL